MTEDAFLAWYPQFSSFTPAVVLRETVSRANGLFSGMEPEDAEEARRLYTAHRLTLYVLAQPDENNKSPKAAASAAKEAFRHSTGKKVGEVSVTYGDSSAAMQSTGLADLTGTAYGIRLLTLLRLYSRSRYIP